MAVLIEEKNLSHSWLAALDYLLQNGGKTVQLVVAIQVPGEEDTHVRTTFDAFIRDHKNQSLPPINTVANTIFPQALYHPKLGEKARPHLYQAAAQAFSVSRRLPINSSGTYFSRLIAWPTSAGPFNQLECIVNRLEQQLKGQNLSSVYELGLSIPDSCPAEDSPLEMRVFSPGQDRRLRGFPCLSHIGLTLHNRRVHMTATYRNQHFIRRAYGNYLGLSRLLGFVCNETNCELGELLCVATHADAEVGSSAGLGRQVLSSLVEECRAERIPKLMVGA